MFYVITYIYNTINIYTHIMYMSNLNRLPKPIAPNI